eukprot:TRINITY_DN10115_c1_g2_i1.p1 TRINITY_DN10115_c1_g2~~TRINITY_DN10115_c1_g2_i1.p1  ORF type:complete len:376 (-),score=49.88 TRINITY_DN10115_c1_g2_i1:96-1223(-)
MPQRPRFNRQARRSEVTRRKLSKLARERQGVNGRWESNEKKAAARAVRRKTLRLGPLFQTLRARAACAQANALAAAQASARELEAAGAAGDDLAVLVALRALEPLPVTAKLLRATMLPRRVREATRCCPAAQETAHRLISRWRDAFRVEVERSRAHQMVTQASGPSKLQGIARNSSSTCTGAGGAIGAARTQLGSSRGISANALPNAEVPQVVAREAHDRVECPSDPHLVAVAGRRAAIRAAARAAQAAAGRSVQKGTNVGGLRLAVATPPRPPARRHRSPSEGASSSSSSSSTSSRSSADVDESRVATPTLPLEMTPARPVVQSSNAAVVGTRDVDVAGAVAGTPTPQRPPRARPPQKQQRITAFLKGGRGHSK